MDGGPAPEGGAVEAALIQWRHKATDALLAVSVLTYLPAIVLLMAGKIPPATMFVKATMLGTYMVVVLSTVMRRTDFRIRACAMLIAAYILMFVGNIAAPQGPFLRALPVLMPVLTIVLFGVRAGRYATLVSSGILMGAPLLNRTPALMGVITAPQAGQPPSLAVTLTQSTVLTGALIAAMILLEHFYTFLLQSLESLEKESADRREACRKLEREMAERKRLAREVTQAGDEERRRLGHEIHDGVCQQLTGALLRSEALARRLDRNDALASEDLYALSSVIEEAIDEAHAVAQGLCPLAPDAEALAAALRTLVKRTGESSGIACQFETSGDVSLSDPTTAHHLYRIAQEAVINAVRHAHATRITVTLREPGIGLLLEVRDNGVGMTGGISAVGMGLNTMRYRAGLLEGDLRVTSAPEKGTLVSCRVPGRGRSLPGNYPLDKELSEYGR